MVTCVSGGRARSALRAEPGARFADVRWVAETTSTNSDLLGLARHGAPEGIVVVADHQTAGRGRAGRSWVDSPASALLASVLLRPPARVVGLVTMATAVAAADAVRAVAGFTPRLKWPNDLVWPGDGSAGDRKLAGVLAEADWPAGVQPGGDGQAMAGDEPVAVVVGIGINVRTLRDPSGVLADTAVACDEVAEIDVDREDLLVEVCRGLDHWYSRLLDGDDAGLCDAWRARSATLGRRVRAHMGTYDVEGVAADITPQGHLLVDSSEGRRTITAGDVVHLRPA